MCESTSIQCHGRGHPGHTEQTLLSGCVCSAGAGQGGTQGGTCPFHSLFSVTSFTFLCDFYLAIIQFKMLPSMTLKHRRAPWHRVEKSHVSSAFHSGYGFGAGHSALWTE